MTQHKADRIDRDGGWGLGTGSVGEQWRNTVRVMQARIVRVEAERDALARQLAELKGEQHG